MALNIDTTAALRTTDELLRLVDAVTVAGTHDETDFLELKSTLDLSTAEAKFKIAKAILGFSNRSVEVAGRNFEGCAYLLVGVDEQGIHGVSEVDVAKLEHALAPYLGTGADAPRWTCRYVIVDNLSVLVVMVESPKPGERIRTLRKAYDKTAAGTIFIRGQAKTETATPDEIRTLEDRLISGLSEPQMDLEVEPVVSDGSLRPIKDYREPEHINAWVSKRRAALLTQIPPPSSGSTATSLFGTFAGGYPTTQHQKDTFIAEVDNYLSECKPLLRRWTIRNVVLSDHNKIALRVRNPHATTLTDVRVTVEMSGSAADVFDVAPADSKLPPAPNWKVFSHAALAIPQWSMESAFDPAEVSLRHTHPGNVSVETNGVNYQITWRFGDLHAYQELVGDQATVIPTNSQPIELRWFATAGNRSGQCTAKVTLACEH